MFDEVVAFLLGRNNHTTLELLIVFSVAKQTRLVFDNKTISFDRVADRYGY